MSESGAEADDAREEVEVPPRPVRDESPLGKLNAFLDTPLVDANNRSDEGPVAEALKAFVRNDPQVASVTFSGVVILCLVIAVRVLNGV